MRLPFSAHLNAIANILGLRPIFGLILVRSRDAVVRRHFALLLILAGVAPLSGCNFLESLFLGPSLTTKTLPNAVVGTPYAARVEASGADLSSFYVSDGKLPPGLQFDGGRISGTPTTGGTFKFEVTVADTSSDSTYKSDSRRYTVLVLDVTTRALGSGTANQAYGPVSLGAIGQVGTLSWSVTTGGLPGGVTLSGAGVLGGAPGAGGNFPFTVKATDQDTPPRSILRDFNLSVLNPLPSLSSLSPSSVAPGGPSFTLALGGSDFVTTSGVQWNGADRPTVFKSSSQLEAAIPATDIATVGAASVTVTNPPPNGGISNGLTFSISPSAAAAHTLLRVSLDSSGIQGNGPSARPAIARGGRYIVFESSADNLIARDSNGVSDIFLRDTCYKAESDCHPNTTRVSLSSNDSESNGASIRPSISADGRYVAFTSLANNLVEGDQNAAADIFLRDTCTGAGLDCHPSTVRISVGGAQEEANARSDSSAVSAAGRFIVFSSGASNLVSGDTNQAEDIFLRDTCIGEAQPCSPATFRVSLDESGAQPQGASLSASISAGGRFVAFASEVPNPQSSGPAATQQIFLRDTCVTANPDCHPSIRRVSVAGQTGFTFTNSFQPSISADGRFVTFVSAAFRSEAPQRGVMHEIFLRDTCMGAATACNPSTLRVSAPAGGGSPNAESLTPIVSSSGRYVGFVSRASNLVADDTNQRSDIFVRDTCLGVSSCVPATWRLARGKLGYEADADSTDLAFGAEGITLAFSSAAKTLDSDDTNNATDVFLAIQEIAR